MSFTNNGLLFEDSGALVTSTSGSGTGASASQVQGTAADNAAATGNPVLVAGQYNSTPQTYDSGDAVKLQTDQNGNTLVSLAVKLDPINDGITTYSNGSFISTISTATTTTVVSFPCVIDEIRVVGGTLGNVTVYDNTAASGTNPIPAVTPDKGQVLIGRSVSFAVGCTIVTAAATIVTVTWRAQ